MITRGAENLSYEVIDNINQLLQNSESEYRVGVEFSDKERFLLVDGKKKKQYYSVIRLFIQSSVNEDKELIWREEVTFNNLTEKRKSLTTNEFLGKVLIYEAIGAFIAINKRREEDHKKNYNPGTDAVYDWDSDYYTQQIPKTEENEATETALPN